MRDLEELTDAINIELTDIKVSEELKLKTLNKCKTMKRGVFYKSYTPVACTLAACLFMGIIIYPIYNKSVLMKNQEIYMNTTEDDIKISQEQEIRSAMADDEEPVMESRSSEIASSESIYEIQRKVNESEKQSQNQIGNNSTVALNKSDPLEIRPKEKNELAKSSGNTYATNGDTIDKNIKDNSAGASVEQSEDKNNALKANNEINMKNLLPQHAIKIFSGDIKIPSYVPYGFTLEKILVPENNYISNKIYEIIYNDNSQYFKIIKYNNININSESSSGAILEKTSSEESTMVINLNNIPVRYKVYEGVNVMEPAFTKLVWVDRGISYSVEGNAPWTELINVVSSIIK